MNASRRFFLGSLAAASLPQSTCFADAKPQPKSTDDDTHPAPNPEKGAANFEKLLKAAQKEIAGMKKFTTDDMIAAGYTLQVGEVDENVTHVFLLAPMRSDYLALRWWNSGDHSPTRLAILFATGHVNRSDTNANIYPDSASMFNEEQKRLRTLEFEIAKKHFKEWNAIAEDIAKKVEKLYEAGEKEEEAAGKK